MATRPLFKSTTLEGAFLEAAFLLEKLETVTNYQKRREKEIFERDLAANRPTNNPEVTADIEKTRLTFIETSYIKITVNTDEQRAVIVSTLPARIKENSFGGFFLAKEFLLDEMINEFSDILLEKL